MTSTSWTWLSFSPKDVEFAKGTVACDGIGTLETYVYCPEGAPADLPEPPRRSPMRAFANTLPRAFGHPGQRLRQVCELQ